MCIYSLNKIVPTGFFIFRIKYPKSKHFNDNAYIIHPTFKNENQSNSTQRNKLIEINDEINEKDILEN